MAWRGETLVCKESALDNLPQLASEIIAYRDQHKEIFGLDNVYVGLWLNDHKLYIEPSARVDSLAEAAALAVQTYEISYRDNMLGENRDTHNRREIVELLIYAHYENLYPSTSIQSMPSNSKRDIEALIANLPVSIKDAESLLSTTQERLEWEVRTFRDVYKAP